MTRGNFFISGGGRCTRPLPKCEFVPICSNTQGHNIQTCSSLYSSLGNCTYTTGAKSTCNAFFIQLEKLNTVSFLSALQIAATACFLQMKIILGFRCTRWSRYSSKFVLLSLGLCAALQHCGCISVHDAMGGKPLKFSKHNKPGQTITWIVKCILRWLIQTSQLTYAKHFMVLLANFNTHRSRLALHLQSWKRLQQFPHSEIYSLDVLQGGFVMVACVILVTDWERRTKWQPESGTKNRGVA